MGWHFWKLKAQSSNVSLATFQRKETFELWVLSFKTEFENVTPSGIGCTRKMDPSSSFWIFTNLGDECTWWGRGRLRLGDVPTNNILPAHNLWAGSLNFPPGAGCFFHGRQVRPGKSEATRPIPWHQDRAGYAPLRFRFRCWWARRWRIIAIIGLHCLFEIGNRYLFWQRKLAQLLYLCVSPFCTRSQGLVLKPQSLPHRVEWVLLVRLCRDAENPKKIGPGRMAETLRAGRQRRRRKNPPPPGGFLIYYVPSSRTVSKRTPLEEFVQGSSMGVLLLTVLGEGNSK